MLRFVTSNAGKAREASQYLPEAVERVDYDYPEIQSDSLEAIATAGARDAYREIGEPVFVDDSGLFIDALGGFPGPYSSYVDEKLGIERVQALAAREENDRARFRTVVAYADDDGVETFEGTVRGRIVAPRGSGGFGYDPIFEHRGQTFAEMSPEEKNAVSHRGRALAAFGDWLAER
ncbi:XTP/dITP diphosphatase [Halalkalicoccus jeotgali]|uniref:dITP/XTP pyrophosphatase n=1 Tax=Halalkalicoccus jeotgali (strain DSM 18796 / CECT 7217 / JCM 14584 / KCTC 4019 / B3) TaxID=795797 RepID=D8J8U6_HALJB|nr:XTP/dITP diphosphatase [Halalkalicoccus jeotgali]ADJ14281.1 Ham1 family protein [Halalkalicoccus jeotgali B3]ELY40543.1 Ham1 family protein [Halalkalicoccus jeotgali B3]